MPETEQHDREARKLERAERRLATAIEKGLSAHAARVAAFKGAAEEVPLPPGRAYLTTGQIAAELGVSKRSLERWRQKGQLPNGLGWVLMGGRYRYYRQSPAEMATAQQRRA